MTTEIDTLKSKKFWKAVLAESIGTFILVFIACGSCLDSTPNDGSKVVRIALTFGAVLTIIIYALGPISGSHVNPTISVAMAVCRRISVVRAAFYVLAQCLGAILAAAILYGLTPAQLKPTTSLGATTPAFNLTDGQAFAIEFFASIIFSFSVFSTTDPIHEIDNNAPFIIGIVIAAIHLYAVPLTGCSLNAARSFGPALIRGIWTSHWLYWFATLLGGVVGGALYDQAFSSKSSLKQMRSVFMGKLPAKPKRRHFELKADDIKIQHEINEPPSFKQFDEPRDEVDEERFIENDFNRNIINTQGEFSVMPDEKQAHLDKVDEESDEVEEVDEDEKHQVTEPLKK